MNTKEDRMLFNRKPLVYRDSMEEPSQELVRNTLGLVNASIEDAVRYGGELTRAALSTMKIRDDRKHIVVDTKVHMLMPGILPALPGWHTDGVPRGVDLNPLAKDVPRIDVQEKIERGDLPGYRPTRYHMLVTGKGCLTQFVNRPVELEVRPSWGTIALYGDLSKQVDTLGNRLVVSIPSCTAIEFDWWDIHRGVPAAAHEWRFFIRVAETDLCEPERDLRKAVRTQHQVYAPDPFGW